RLAAEWFGPLTELAFAGEPGSPEFRQLSRTAQERDLPGVLLLHEEAGAREYPLLEGKASPGGTPAAWLCIDRRCLQPAHTAAELASRFAGHT
ncbi:MAG TPA: hypothetical protein VK092_02835, partial [Deinococcales bacterium]|nr:hypothetical protein [Deinococcales bacterium]